MSTSLSFNLISMQIRLFAMHSLILPIVIWLWRLYSDLDLTHIS